mgnify:FL=1
MSIKDYPTYFTPPNYGLLRKKVPDALFSIIKKECKNIQKLKRKFSGLSGKGIPRHYDLVKCYDPLKTFILNAVQEYDRQFSYVRSIRVLNKDIPFAVETPWANIQERGEFLPSHIHNGVLSYTLWVSIPYDIEKECRNPSFPHATRTADNKYTPTDAGYSHASCFTFYYSSITGSFMEHRLKVSKADEGTLLMFPSCVPHAVYPFTTVDKPRISVSGNVLLNPK